MIFLGVDGGGTKTALCLVTGEGELIARGQAGASYLAGPPGVGPEHVRGVLAEAVPALCRTAGITADKIDFGFFGIPAYGELSADRPLLDAVPRAILGHDRYRVDNDVVCGWAGSLAMADGINVVAGTGSIAYGRRADVGARIGGWGELFGDEGSGYWMAIRGLQVFSQMSDGRLEWGPFGDLVRNRLELLADFDLLDIVQHRWHYDRTKIAALSRLVTEAADAGDRAATKIIEEAAENLVQHVTAVRDRVGFGAGTQVPVSYSGGVFRAPAVLAAFSTRLAAGPEAYELRRPRFEPVIGAALFAAGLAGSPLDRRALDRLGP
ncbi:N-acetylglucosamine kinase [Microlunatus endophyticus]|uniref:N-acetylglucosamine kinase n=1 Tax=Microlunatus endophyticus TaxID=1716077 RepID=A0A917SFI2_9ACTN|nr:BadF/BadG/BcrA/BcrD ATPase family protein [Microlunatus endophyticus]GGL75331.1 N-acetylglucosamine kinase [Microlunatus endophyticus]